jgi:hypothetical protein
MSGKRLETIEEAATHMADFLSVAFDNGTQLLGRITSTHKKGNDQQCDT